MRYVLPIQPIQPICFAGEEVFASKCLISALPYHASPLPHKLSSLTTCASSDSYRDMGLSIKVVS